MTAAEVLLAVEGLHVRLGESRILHGVSFSARAGTVTALLGRNGAGKTTTLRGILGLVERSGTVRLAGRDVSGLPTHELVGRGVGYVPETRDVFAGLTVSENLRLAERPGSPPRYDLVHELFPRLAERSRQPAGTLSGGEQQMLALGRALLNANQLLLVDEPSQGLAPHLVDEVTAALERMRDLATIVLVEQNLEVVRRVAADAVVLDSGHLAWDGPLPDLLGDPERTRALLGVAAPRHREART